MVVRITILGYMQDRPVSSEKRQNSYVQDCSAYKGFWLYAGLSCI